MNWSQKFRDDSRDFINEFIVHLIPPDKNFFIVNTGSVGHGFADEHSNIELEIYLDQTENMDLAGLVKVMSNASEISAKPFSFKFTEWSVNQLLSNQVYASLKVNPITYYEIENSFPVYDPKNFYPRIKNNLKFYNYEDSLRIIRGLYFQISELGTHIANKANKRGLEIESNIAFYSSIEALIRLIHVLNENFFPPTKWLTVNLEKLNNDFELKKMIDKIGREDKLASKLEKFNEYIESFIDEKLKDNYLTAAELLDPWSMIGSKNYILFPTLIDYNY